MKIKSISNKLGGLIKPGSLWAAAMISGFWASLALAIYYVSGAAIGAESKLVGLLYFGLFAVFFLLHSFGPWSKSAALSGLGSLAVLAGFSEYMASAGHLSFVPPITWVILIGASLVLAGILLDAEKYRKWLGKIRLTHF